MARPLPKGLAKPDEMNHPRPVPLNKESARRWSGYVCPDCRFVFRVARAHDGRGVVCPCCHRLLRIPGEDEVPPPLVADLGGAGGERSALADPGAEGRVRNVRRKRKRRRVKSGEPDWERGEPADRPDRRRAASSRGISGVVVLCIGGLMAVAGMLFWTQQRAREVEDISGDVAMENIPSPLEADQGGQEVAAVEPVDERQANQAFLVAAGPVVRGFLTANQVDDLLPHVDQPERVAGRIQSKYPDGNLVAPGLSDYSIFSHIMRKGANWMVPVRTGDYRIRMIVLRQRDEEIKVDWEAWEGWSEQEPKAFVDAREQEPKVFRVMIEPVEYYNFEFSDDQKWKSLRLIFPDEETIIYGYVLKTSQAYVSLAGVTKDDDNQVMLALRYPAADAAANQVEIVDLITMGWIDPEHLDES